LYALSAGNLYSPLLSTSLRNARIIICQGKNSLGNKRLKPRTFFSIFSKRVKLRHSDIT